MYSYQNVVEIILDIAKNHGSIKSVESGDIWKRELQLENQYPLFFVQHQDYVVNDKSFNYNFKLICADVLLQDNSNELQILSNTQKILLDVVNYFRRLDIPKIQIELGTSMSPFTTGFLADCAGNVFDFQIIVPYSANFCDTPIDTLTLPPILPPTIVFITPSTPDYCSIIGSCSNIINIQNDIIDLQEQLDDLPPVTLTLEQVLGYGNSTGNINLSSPNTSNILQVTDTVLGMSWNDVVVGNVAIDNGFATIYHDILTVIESQTEVQILSPYISLTTSGTSSIIINEYQTTITGGTKITSNNDNASLQISSPSGFYYPNLSFVNQGNNVLGSITGYGGALYIGGVGGTPLIVSGAVVTLPLLSSNRLLYNNGSTNIDVVTIGSGLTFSGGVLSSITSTPTLSQVLAVDYHLGSGQRIQSLDNKTYLNMNSGLYVSFIDIQNSYIYQSNTDIYLQHSLKITLDATSINLPNSSSNTLLYSNGSKNIKSSTIGSGLTFSSGILSTTGTFSVSSNDTLTNKRIVPRVLSITSNATPTINTDLYDAVDITALATNITSFTTNLTGTPNNFDRVTIRMKDNGTARAITWGSSFVSRGATLPTTTVIGKITTIGLIWNSIALVWGCVAVAQEV